MDFLKPAQFLKQYLHLSPFFETIFPSLFKNPITNASKRKNFTLLLF